MRVADLAPGSVGRRDHLTFRGNVSQGRHGWLRLTPAYSLRVVQEVLDDAGPSDLVLDPFSWTGTTALVCATMGIECHAVDINPFLVWLGTLKVTRFGPRVSGDVGAAARQISMALDRSTGRPSWTPALHAIEKWWDKKTLASLGRLYELVASQPSLVRDLLQVAFCRVVIETANVSFGHQSMSFRRRVGRDSNVAGRIGRGFLATSEAVAASLEHDQPRARARIYLGDARRLPEALPSSGYTRVVTSPPYPNRMSYIRELRPYMYWLRYLTSGREAGELDWQAIGGTWGRATSLLGSWAPETEVRSERLHAAVASITRDHALLGRYVHKYFLDVRGHVESLRAVLSPGARCHYVVGNSKFYGTLLDVEQIYAETFEAAGFVDVAVGTLRKRTSKRELYEFVVSASLANPSRKGSRLP